MSENRYMSDEDIEAQYKSFKIKVTEVRKGSQGGCLYTGTIEMEFPEADHPDFDEYIIDNFVIYDEERIDNPAFDRWYPEKVYRQMAQAIKEEITIVRTNTKRDEEVSL